MVALGELATAPRPTEANLRKHGRVMEALARSRTAVLPARFATVVDDLDELSAILRTRADDDSPRLGIRDSGFALRAVPNPERRIPNPGRDYLRNRAAEARYVPGFDPIRHVVRRWVRAERIERHDKVTTVYHLIPRGSVDAYRTALARAATAERVRLVVTGPWPPYTFASSF